MKHSFKDYDSLGEATKDATDGAFQSLKENEIIIDSLASRLSRQIVTAAVEGIENIDISVYKDDINGILSGAIQDGLLSAGNREALTAFADQLMFKVDSNLMVTIRKLPNELLSQDLMNRVNEIRSSLLGKETKAQLEEIVSSLVKNANDELRRGLIADLHILLDSAERKGLGFVGTTKEEARDYTKFLIGGIILIIIASGIVIYLVRRKRDQFKEGLLASTRKIDSLDRESYERIKFRPEDFKSSHATYKAINTLIKNNEDLFDKKKKYKNSVGLAFDHILSSIMENYSEEGLKTLLNEAEKQSPELKEFLREQIENINISE
ncbi:MAG: hypothetical protein ABJP45_01095 [Cyclobacteriaceae bacterium]